MKTLQDLVNGLNEIYATQGKYITEYESCTGTLSLYYIRNDIRDSLAMLKPRYRTWSLFPSIGFQGIEAQHAIIDYLTNSNPSDWFPQEKKYNIVLNNLEGEKIVINKYDRHNPFSIECSTGIDDDELKLDAYIFTESEIEQLKLTLPTNMAKIVDLGKVEVKDED